MKQTLGKLFLILFFTINLFADVKVSVSSPAIYKGDAVNFIISADGENIEFPQIDSIEGYTIVGTSSSQSINMINSDITRTTSKTYSFRPDKSVTIPSFTVKADGQTYQTKELQVNVLKPTASQHGSPFVLEMKLNKHEVYVGEGIDLSIAFKRKLNAHADKIQLGEPKLESFWVKKVDNVEHSNEGDYVVQTVHYQLFPQKSGTFSIPAIEALVGKVEQRRGGGGFFNDPFFNSMTQQLNWQKIYSNEENLTVQALPNGLELYGNYKIDAQVDTKKVHANKPVNLTIEIKGEGNIDDVKKFNPSIDNTIVYADEPKISSELVHNIYQGAFTQKIAIIADQNFTIPPMQLSYFDKESKTVKTVETEPIAIEVIGGKTGVVKPSSIEVGSSSTIEAPGAQTVTQTKVVVEKEDIYVKYLFLLIGFLLGAGAMYGFFHLKNRVVKKEGDRVKAIKKAKNDRALFDVLLPYAKKDRVISQALNRLEENLYREGKHKIDREVLMEVFEE
ncbi:BatD family protein [bacterium]|nr:BatD family protein [bacterium]MBU1957709.1 BatD family protein [bacterium]